jgi:hypothetical protein
MLKGLALRFNPFGVKEGFNKHHKSNCRTLLPLAKGGEKGATRDSLLGDNPWVAGEARPMG